MAVAQPIPFPPQEHDVVRRVREWARAEVRASGPELQIPELARRVRDELFTDQDFLDAYLLAKVDELAYSVVRAAVAESRRLSVAWPVRRHRDDRPPTIPVHATRLTGWDKWREHIGDRHSFLLDMTREELAAAIELRDRRRHREHSLIRLYVAIHARLEPGQVVRELYPTHEAVAALDMQLQAADDAVLDTV